MKIMKIMKINNPVNTILGLGLVMLFTFVSCHTDQDNTDEDYIEKNAIEFNDKDWQVVGMLKDGKPNLTANKDLLLSSFNKNLLSKSQIRGNFTDVVLKPYKKDFQLVFRGAKYTSSFYVKENDSGKLFVNHTTTCTTTDCSMEPEGCIVTYELSKPGMPGTCTPCANGGVCRKTVSNSALFTASN